MTKGTDANSLLSEAKQFASTALFDDETRFSAYLDKAKRAEIEDLYEVISRLTTKPGESAANLKAIREGLISIVEERCAHRIVETLVRLDKSAKLMSYASFFLGAVSVIVAVLELSNQS